MNISSYIDSAFCTRLIVTLGHFLWQAAAVALIVGIASLLLRKTISRVRYNLFVLALLIMATCPVVTFQLVNASRDSLLPEANQSISAEGIPPISFVPDAALPDGAEAKIEAPHVGITPDQTAISTMQRSETPGAGVNWPNWKRFAPYLAILYFAGVLMMLVRLLFGLHGGRRLRQVSQPVDTTDVLAALARQAKAMGLRFMPAVAYCARVTVPTVVGILRPMILLPMSLASGLTMEQIESILAHELAHIRRHDHLINLLQRVIESLLFFHPAVWYVSRKISLEREHCCDDMVLATGRERHIYAESLLRLAEFGQTESPGRLARVAALGAVDKPSRLRTRIVRLFGQSAHERMRLVRSWPIALLIVLLCAVTLLPIAKGQPKENATPVTEKAARQPDATDDQTILQDLARQILTAIRNKDDAKLQAMSVDRVKGWKDAWPHFAMDVRERFTQITGRPFTMHPTRSIIKDDVAVVQCTGPKELNGDYMVLFFVKTDSDWKNFSIYRISPPSIPLEHYLNRASRPQNYYYASEDIIRSISGTVSQYLTLTMWEDLIDGLEAGLGSADSQESFRKLMESLEPKSEEYRKVVPNAVVTAQSDTVRAQTVSDSEGAFKFPGLPYGEYRVSSEIPPPSGEKAPQQTASINIRLDKKNHWIELELRSDLVTIQGRITDNQGHPVVGAKITGLKYIDYSLVDSGEVDRWVRQTSVSTISNADGSYELRGLLPNDPIRIGRYLYGGNPVPVSHIVRVEKDGFEQTEKRVPLVTQGLLPPARRLMKAFKTVEARLTGSSSVQEKEGLALPSSTGNTITDIDIVLGQFTVSPLPPSVPPAERTPDGKLVIPSQRPWTDTGINVKTGDRISLLAASGDMS